MAWSSLTETAYSPAVEMDLLARLESKKKLWNFTNVNPWQTRKNSWSISGVGR